MLNISYGTVRRAKLFDNNDHEKNKPSKTASVLNYSVITLSTNIEIRTA